MSMEHGCGCCGRLLLSPRRDALWCADCEKHVSRAFHMCDRTWFAQTGTQCPFSEETA